MEFKVCDERTEKNLKQTAENALKQIEEKNYEADILAASIPAAKICKLGFAFQGKEVLVPETRTLLAPPPAPAPPATMSNIVVD